MAMFLLTGLPPFLRVKELRPKDRGDLWLGLDLGLVGQCALMFLSTSGLVHTLFQNQGKASSWMPRSALRKGMVDTRGLVRSKRTIQT